MLKNLLLLLVAIALFLLLIEGVATLYIKITKQDLPLLQNSVKEDDKGNCHIFDAELGYRLRPFFISDSIQINSLGFRSSREFALDGENAQKKKIIILGDSMVFGIFVPQADIFSEILDRELPRYVFINTGVSGYSTVQEYLILKKYADKIKPEWVILFYSQENDIWYNVRSDCFSISAFIKNDKLFIKPAERIIKYNDYFYKKLNFYRLLDAKLLKGRDHIYLMCILDFIVRGEHSYAWRVTRKIIHEIGEISRKKNFNLVIIDVLGPSAIKNKWKAQKRQDLLRRACLEENFLYYAIDNYYPEDYQGLFLNNDSHWSQAGHRFVAEFIKKILTENKAGRLYPAG